MDAGLWEKLQRMAAAGDRVVVVNDGEAFVLIPLADYERMRNGEASLQKLPGFEMETFVLHPEPAAPVTEKRSLELGPAGLWAPQPEREEERFSLGDGELGLAADEAEEEERFYLEPVE